jgi:hypothetical protein
VRRICYSTVTTFNRGLFSDFSAVRFFISESTPARFSFCVCQRIRYAKPHWEDVVSACLDISTADVASVQRTKAVHTIGIRENRKRVNRYLRRQFKEKVVNACMYSILEICRVLFSA